MQQEMSQLLLLLLPLPNMEELLPLKPPSSSRRLVPPLCGKHLKQPRKIELNQIKENMDVFKFYEKSVSHKK